MRSLLLIYILAFIAGYTAVSYANRLINNIVQEQTAQIATYDVGDDSFGWH